MPHKRLTQHEAEKLGLKLDLAKQTETDEKGADVASYAAYTGDMAQDQIFRHRVTFDVVNRFPDSFHARAGAAQPPMQEKPTTISISV